MTQGWSVKRGHVVHRGSGVGEGVYCIRFTVFTWEDALIGGTLKQLKVLYYTLWEGLEISIFQLQQ